MDKPKPNKLAQFYSGQIQPNGALSLRRSVQFWSGVDNFDFKELRQRIQRRTKWQEREVERINREHGT